MLSETIAELERLEKAATSAPWCVDDHVVNPDDADGSWHIFESGEDDPPLMSTDLGTEDDARLVALLRTHARAILAAAKLSEKMPKYADTGEAFVPEVDPSWICQLSGHPCKMSPGWHAPDRKWMVAGREQFYSTPEAAANAWQAKTASENNTREKQK